MKSEGVQPAISAKPISPQALDALLPQTQCGECGYAGCLPYAEALAAGHAPIDRCPPGGVQTLKELAKLLNVDPTPYLADAEERTRPPKLAVIREAECIGCTKCIMACPVDAIIGSGKLLHHVLPDECTGCGLCVEPCPVDCIEMVTLPAPTYQPVRARHRYHAREIRKLRIAQEKEHVYRQKRQLVKVSYDEERDRLAKQDYILQALKRTQQKHPRA